MLLLLQLLTAEKSNSLAPGLQGRIENLAIHDLKTFTKSSSGLKFIQNLYICFLPFNISMTSF